MNNGDSDFSAIVEPLITKEDAVFLVREIDECLEHLYTVSQSPFEAMGKYISHEMKERIKQVMEKKGISLEDPKVVEAFLLSVKEVIKQVPVMQLYIAIHPSEECEVRVSNWVEQNFNEKVLLEIVIDKSVIAGAKISFSGKIHDYSLGKRISSLLPSEQQP